MVQALIDALRTGRLLAFLGAGVSRPFRDTDTGTDFPGLPTAGELVAELQQTRPSLVVPGTTFSQACFLLRESEGRVALERFLQINLDKPTLKPLPAHFLCATIPFAGYITTNFDTLLEKALGEAKRQFHVLISDESATRLRVDQIPIVKLHGCITNPGTLIAADDEYKPLVERTPILEAFIKFQMASKTTIFLGFSLQDKDFQAAYDELHTTLGQWKPKSYAVVNNPSAYDVQYWGKKGVELINQDLTAFLKEFITAGTAQGNVMLNRRAVHHSEEWRNNPFFASLLSIRTLPSETQVIDAFLSHLLGELRIPSRTLLDVISRARGAKDLVMLHRVNYVALQQLSEKLLNDLVLGCGNDKDKAEEQLNNLINERNRISLNIRDQTVSQRIIKKGANILVYSQSIRVLDILSGVPRGIQGTCYVYLAECRPKSPDAFQDALSSAEHLKSMAFKIKLIPDSAIGHLIENNQVDTILMGAHAVYFDGATPRYFVNTCGSLMVLRAAEQKLHSVQVYVIAEKIKHVLLPNTLYPPSISYDEEEALYTELVGRLTELKATGLDISTVNIGYDLCPFTVNTKLICET